MFWYIDREYQRGRTMDVIFGFLGTLFLIFIFFMVFVILPA